VWNQLKTRVYLIREWASDCGRDTVTGTKERGLKNLEDGEGEGKRNEKE